MDTEKYTCTILWCGDASQPSGEGWYYYEDDCQEGGTWGPYPTLEACIDEVRSIDLVVGKICEPVPDRFAEMVKEAWAALKHVGSAGLEPLQREGGRSFVGSGVSPEEKQ